VFKIVTHHENKDHIRSLTKA